MQISTSIPLWLALGLPAVASAQISFSPAVHFAAGSKPSGGAALDYDLDGDLDVIVSCRGSDILAFLRNRGDGTFAAPAAFAMPSNSNPEGIATGDFDHDGDADLAVVLYGTQQVQLAWANGDGTFAPGPGFPLGSEPSMIVTVDLNQDGWLDLAINERAGGDIAVLLSNQAGGFGAATFYAVGAETRDVTYGDVTGDGIPDLAATSRDDRRVRVFANQGNGTFQLLRDISYGSQLEPHGIGMAHMDRDGWLDLYSVSRGSVFEAPQVVLRFNGGNPWIGPINGAFAGVGTVGVCHGDFDLDGNVDIATCNADSNDVSVMRNAGIGIFNRGIEFPVGTNPDCPEMLSVDLDNDGDLDLVTFNEGSNDISVLENNERLCQQDLGFGGPGSARLTVCGQPLASGGQADLALSGGAANQAGALVGSATFGALPIFGGTLVPVGLELVLPLTTNGNGGYQLLGLPGGGGPASVYVQVLILDAAQAQGVAFSNAVKLQVLP